MGFDNRKQITYSADAPSYTAKIAPGTNVQTASIQYKAGFKIGPPSITTSTMDQLMGELTKLDSAVRFFKRGEDTNALSAKDAAALEGMRTDPSVSDARYRSACSAFGQKPQPRNVAATVASAPQQTVASIVEQGLAWQQFEAKYATLFGRPFGELNVGVILQYLQDENLQSTSENLEQAYRELRAAGCFRQSTVLTRFNGALQAVQPYSHELIVAMRNKQTRAAVTAAPATLSSTDKAAWDHVVANHPTVPVGSAAFRELCSKVVLQWAKEYALKADPSLAAANKRGELRVAVDKAIMGWTRNPNLGQGQKTIKDTRIWLGSIFF